MARNGGWCIGVEVEALREILTALRIGREALIDHEVLMESSETVLAEGWDDVDRKMHEHEKKITQAAIEKVAAILELEV